MTHDLTLNVIDEATPTHISARVLGPTNFQVLTENIIKSISWARKELEVSSVENIGIVFESNLGVKAEVLNDLARVCKNEVFEFSIFPTGAPSGPEYLEGKPTLLITHERSRTFLDLVPINKKLKGEKRFRELVVFDFYNKPEDNNQDKWIAKAVGKDPNDQRPYLKKHYGNIAADGKRSHFDSSLTPILHDGVSLPDGAYNMVYQSMKSASYKIATFDSKELQSAVKVASAIRKDMITLTITNRPRMVVGVKSEGKGKGGTSVKVKYAGKEATINVNPKYLIDALSGMSGEVKMKHDAKGYKILLTCGTREAVVMCMKV